MFNMRGALLLCLFSIVVVSINAKKAHPKHKVHHGKKNVTTMVGTGLADAKPISFVTALAADEIATCVADANQYRLRHKDTGEMQWDEELAKGAMEWADQLAKESLATDDVVFEHSTSKQRPGQGENLFWVVGADEGTRFCEAANKAWYDEIKDWDFDTAAARPPAQFADVGHFTQLVWKDSLKFGVGVAKGEFGEYWDKHGLAMYFVVARYSPPGNYNNRYKEKIGTLIKPMKRTRVL